MGLELKNVKLDKEVYIYWIDENINLSFELYSEKNETIKEINIYYWYNFFWNYNKYNAFQDKIIEENKIISEWMPEKLYFTIPIQFFNFDDIVWKIQIENYINITIKNNLFSLKIKERILPNIIFDKKGYDLSNFSLFENILNNNIPEDENNNFKEDSILSNLEEDNSYTFLGDKYNKFKEDKNTEDCILIKRHFKGAFSWFTTSFIEKNKNLGDYVHKDIYNKLKENTIVNIFDKLINSEIYCFIYRYIYILLFIGIFFYTLTNYNIILTLLIFIPILVIWFSKLLEKLFNSKLDNSMYDIKQISPDNIKNNIEQNLINWSLKITDIFDKFTLKLNDTSIDYNFKVLLFLNVWTYYTTGWKNSSTIYLNSEVYSIKLFNYIWKGDFDLSKVHLLENNYNKLIGILPKSNTNPKTKVYYTLAYKCKSNHIPDIDREMELYLNFNK